MLVYAPVGGVLTAFGYELLALAGAVVVVGGTMVPDYDRSITRLRRRGPTHTVWFAGLFGLLVGAVWGLLGNLVAGASAAPGLFGFGLLVGTLAVVVHILGDVLTVDGVRPFAPVSDRRYAVGMERAMDLPSNYLLLAVGATVFACAFLLGGILAG